MGRSMLSSKEPQQAVAAKLTSSDLAPGITALALSH